MVSRVLALMSREVRGLHEAAYLLALFAFLSQVLALVRDRTFAHFFGAGPVLDAYFAAFKIPDLLFAFLTLFVSSFAIIPLITKYGGVQTEQSRTLIGSVFLMFGLVSIVSAIVLFVTMPALVPKLFPGFSPETKSSIVMLSQIMLLQPLFLGLSSIAASVVQASRKFFIYALAPIFYNVGIIVGALFFYPLYGVAGLAWGVVLGAFAHFSIQLIPLLLKRDIPHPRFSGKILSDVWLVVRASVPRALALSANQLLLLFFISIASLAAAGSVASISFAYNLQSMPLSIVGVSYATALFPSLALLFSKGEKDLFVGEVWAAVRHIIFWTAPAIALLIVLRAQIVRVILGSGEFSWSDTRLTAAILAAFSFSLIAQATLLVFSRGYYAAHKEKTPVVINVLIAVCAGFVAYTSFLWFQGADVARHFVEHLFRISSIPGSEVVMIALAYSLVTILGAVCFAARFSYDFGFDKKVIKTFFLAFSASVIGGSAAYVVLQLTGPLLPTETFIGIFLQGFIAGIVGLLVWGSTLFLLRSQEFDEVLAVASRFVNKNT